MLINHVNTLTIVTPYTSARKRKLFVTEIRISPQMIQSCLTICPIHFH